MQITIQEEKEYRDKISKIMPSEVGHSTHITNYVYKLPQVVVEILSAGGPEEGHLDVYTYEEYAEHIKPLSQQLAEAQAKIERMKDGTDEEKQKYAEYVKSKEEANGRLRELLGKPTQKNGLELITFERKRHFELGYDAFHDSHETKGELAVAGGLYALDGTYADEVFEEISDSLPDEGNPFNSLWPWKDVSDKRGKMDRIRQLAVAGSLIAAEIDRLLKLK